MTALRMFARRQVVSIRVTCAASLRGASARRLGVEITGWKTAVAVFSTANTSGATF